MAPRSRPSTNNLQYASHDPDEAFLTKDQLWRRLNLPSKRKLEYMMKARMIPFQKWGPKTIRFEWFKVKAALEKFERKAVAQ